MLQKGQTTHRFSIWKTIEIGTGLKTSYDFCKAIRDAGMGSTSWADDVLGKSEFVTAPIKAEVDLTMVSVRDLGFKEGATLGQIYARAKELGLELCPPEVGPQLRLQYPDQPMEMSIFIAMEPIRHPDGELCVFTVQRNASGLWLDINCLGPDYVWDVRTLVFSHPRK